jgi:hypothetical protein
LQQVVNVQFSIAVFHHSFAAFPTMFKNGLLFLYFVATLVNSDIEKSAKGSLSYESGKEYSFETRVMISRQRKNVVYEPLLTVRTPDTILAAFGGSIAYVKEQSYNVKLTLDKITEKPITLESKYIWQNCDMNHSFKLN